MKKDIQPKLNHVVFVDYNTKTEFKTMSTLTSDKTKVMDGTEYFVIETDITSASHPFYTGKHRIVDTENLVKKFEKKAEKAEKLSDKIKAKKIKLVQRRAKSNEIKESKGLTLKDMLKQVQ